MSGGESRVGHVIVRALDRDAATTLAGVRNPSRPFLSPDGRWLGFTDMSQGRMFKVPTSGSAPVPIAPSRWGGATWGRDGTIVCGERYNAGLSRVSQEGGPVTLLTHPDTTRGELGHWWPHFLPDGRHVLFCAYASPLDLETGQRTVIVEGGLMPRYVASGHLLYARNGTLMAVPFDPVTLRTRGSAVPVVSYSGSQGNEVWTAPLDGSEPPRRWLAADGALGHPVMSPDGRWIAYDGNESGTVEVFIQSWPDPARARRQISSGGASEPLWTRGGRELVYRMGDSVMAVSIDPASGTAGTPALLFAGRYMDSPDASGTRNWDATPDGERFILVKRPPELQARRINVVLNWLDELRVKVPTR